MANLNYQQAKHHKELARNARQEKKLRRSTVRVTSISENAKRDATPALRPDGVPPSVVAELDVALSARESFRLDLSVDSLAALQRLGLTVALAARRVSPSRTLPAEA